MTSSHNDSNMTMDFYSPTAAPKEGIASLFISPTGVIDEVHHSNNSNNNNNNNISINHYNNHGNNRLSRVPHYAPNLDPASEEDEEEEHVEKETFYNIPVSGLSGLPQLTGPTATTKSTAGNYNDMEQDDDEAAAAAAAAKDSCMASTKVAETFDEKEQQRRRGSHQQPRPQPRQVKFCPWKQAQECSQDFRNKAYTLEKQEAMTFRTRKEREEQQQENDLTSRRIQMFRQRALQKQGEEARDFRNVLRIRREVCNLENNNNNSPRSNMMLRKRLFEEAMAD